MKAEDVIQIYESEFPNIVKAKFETLKIDNFMHQNLDIKVVEKLKFPNSDNNIIWHPGVYIFLGDGRPFRVGRSFSNSRARVMEHIKFNTDNIIEDLRKCKDVEIILFNLKEFDIDNKEKDIHWLSALEVFLELKLRKQDLKIWSRRLG